MGSFQETCNDNVRRERGGNFSSFFSLLLPFPLRRCFSCSNKLSEISKCEWTRPYIVPLSDHANRSWSTPGLVL